MEKTGLDIENKNEIIKSCPFCGEDDLHFHKEPSNDKTITWHRILHGPTTACGVSMLGTNKDELIEKWNKRVDTGL